MLDYAPVTNQRQLSQSLEHKQGASHSRTASLMKYFPNLKPNTMGIAVRHTSSVGFELYTSAKKLSTFHDFVASANMSRIFFLRTKLERERVPAATSASRYRQTSNSKFGQNLAFSFRIFHVGICKNFNQLPKNLSYDSFPPILPGQ